MTPSQFSSGFEAAARGVSNAIARASTAAGQRSLRFFELTFQRGGYEPEKSFVPWARRKYSYSHELLHKAGRLAASFRLVRQGAGFAITNTAPYAGYVNEGTTHTPARPILYTSKELETELESVISKELASLFKF